MFTGLIEEIGMLKSIHKTNKITRIVIQAKNILLDAKLGDSIACNGVCLTISKFTHHCFEAELMPETLHRTEFSHYVAGTEINLERATMANTRLGGHILSGHIDTVGVIQSILKLHDTYQLKIGFDPAYQHLIVDKGAIAIDGISLTLISTATDHFTVGIIPHTFTHTILQRHRTGNLVNLEFDIQGKYAYAQRSKFNQNTRSSAALSLDKLANWGY